MTSDCLTIKTPISEFTDNQIREAMQSFDGDSPLDIMIGIVEIMIDYIMNNDAIPSSIRNNFALLDSMYRFNLKLFKNGIGE